jgi:hypothetical protein
MLNYCLTTILQSLRNLKGHEISSEGTKNVTKTMIERDMSKHTLPILKVENWKRATRNLSKIRIWTGGVGNSYSTSSIRRVTYWQNLGNTHFWVRRWQYFVREIRCSIIVSLYCQLIFCLFSEIQELDVTPYQKYISEKNINSSTNTNKTNTYLSPLTI